MFNKIFVLAAVSFIMISCNNKKESFVPKPDVLASNVDTLVKPSEDFFEYANGGWIKRNPIPADEKGWGIAYVVNEENQQRLKTINEEAIKNSGAKGTASQMIGDFWKAAMDTVAIEKEGTQKLQPWFNKINGITDINSLIEIVGDLSNIGVQTLFRNGVDQDEKNSDLESYRLSQGGLGLPEREYYFKTDSSTVNIRNSYVNHITKMFELNGTAHSDANKAAASILAFETKLAAASRKLEDLRDPYANYHKMAINDLSKMCSVINWKKFLFETGVKNIDSVIVGQPEFFGALNDVLKSTA